MIFGNSKIKEIKGRHRLESFLTTHYGVELNKAGSDSLEAKCPFNAEDKTPSFRVTPSKQLYNCFCAKCNSSGGDIITFVTKYDSIDKKEAVKRLLNGHYHPVVKSASTPSLAAPTQATTPKAAGNKTTILKDVTRIFEGNFVNNQSAQEYMISRGITKKEIWKKYQFGYSDGKGVKNATSHDAGLTEHLQTLGLLNENKNESFYKCITIPLRTDRGALVGLYGRSTDPDQKRQMYFKGKRMGIFNGVAAKNHDSLIVCESIIDALSWIQCDFNNVIATFGANGWTEEHDSFIQSHDFKEVILSFDNDEAGLSITQAVKKKIESHVSKISMINLPEGIKDPNDFLSNGASKEDFQVLIDNCSSLIAPEEYTKVIEGLLEPVEKTKEALLFNIDGLSYRVRPIRSKSFDSLKAVITVFNEDQKHNDSVNLYLAKNRQGFAYAVANRLMVQAAKVEDDLYQIINYLEYVRLKEIDERHNGTDDIISLTAKEKGEALRYLKRDDLIKAILKDVKSVGYVGQEKEVLMLYISFISHMLDQQIHISIQSSSSSGKSDMMAKVASLLPPEKVKIHSRMSSQALYYGSNLDGVIILDEKSAVDDAGALALRSLMSRGELTLAVVQRDPFTG